MRLNLFARIALIIVGGLLVAQATSLWLQWDERAIVVAQARGLHFVDRLADAVRALEADASPGRIEAIAGLQREGLQVELLPPERISANVPRGQLAANLAARLGGERELRSPGGMGGMGAMNGMGNMGGGMRQRDSALRTFDVRLRDGTWVRIAGTREAAAPALSNNLMIELAVTLLVVAVLAMLAVRQTTRPLERLAQAADALGDNLDAQPLGESGSPEMRRAAQAFNRMQARIRRLVDERSRALAAVSHDLRTPLTRLRLRSELIDDNELRTQMANDLEAMAAMLDATLDYLRGLQESETTRPIDIDALLQSLVEDAAAIGKTVSVTGQAQAPYPGRLAALRRALQNLIDNAIKYGNGAHLRVEDDTLALRLTVEDRGPGIAPDELERVKQPFYRPDASRSRDTGGVGLGLSIANDVALLHGGRLLLANRPDGGLAATLDLPRRAAT